MQKKKREKKKVKWKIFIFSSSYFENGQYAVNQSAYCDGLFDIIQPVFTCSKSAIETPGKCVQS